MFPSPLFPYIGAQRWGWGATVLQPPPPLGHFVKDFTKIEYYLAVTFLKSCLRPYSEDEGSADAEQHLRRPLQLPATQTRRIGIAVSYFLGAKQTLQ